MQMIFNKESWSRSSDRTTKMTKEMEDLTYMERLREMGLFSLEGRRFMGNLILVSKCLMGGNNEEGLRFLSVVPAGGVRSNGYTLKTMKF